MGSQSRPRFKLTNAPLVLVVAQLKISPIVSVEKFVPEVQERFRHAGFPRYRKDQIPELRVDLGSMPRIETLDRYEFQDKDARTGIVLTPYSIILQTSRYDHFHVFHAQFRTALGVIGDTLKISLRERLGMRFVNAIYPEPAEEIHDYVHEGLLGLNPSSVGVKAWNFQSQFLGGTDVGTLMIKVSGTPGGGFLPPDLTPSTLTLSQIRTGQSPTILDFDHFLEQSADYNSEEVLKLLNDLHTALDRAFLTSVTKGALQKWGYQSLET